MNKHANVAGAIPAGISQGEWQARVDLAAVYRLTAHYGWDDVIYNHSSMRVPGEPRMFLMKKHDLLYTEVTASNLVKVNMDQDLDEKSGVNRPGFTLHGGVLGARDDVNCAVHVHTNNGMAIGALKHGLRMVSQQAIRFYQRIGYHKYEGITEDFAERERINKDLGKNRARILRADEGAARRLRHPDEAGGDRRRHHRNSRGGLRQDRRAIRAPRCRPRQPRLGRLSAHAR
jgi:ribulose-5-phosphate 4-epimerase/fuculose-1-phosphate aldolase